MTKLKGLIAVLLVLAFLCSLAGCGPEQTQTPEGENTVESGTTDEFREPDIDPNAPIKFLKSDVAEFKIVYAAELGEEAVAEVEKLAQRIRSVCNADITVTDDLIKSDDEQTKEWEHELLIGVTNREESAEFVKDFRPSDYGYGYLNGKIVIGAGSDAKVKNAILMFIEDVIAEYASEEIFYQSDWIGLEKKTYTIERLILNGASIKDYTIVYVADSDLFEKGMADRLQGIVSEQTGYVLPIKSDAEVDTAEKAFLIGKTKFSADLTALSANEGCVLGNGTNVIAYGDDIQGVVNSSKLLTNLLFDASSTEKTREVTIGNAQTSKGADAFSVMTHNLSAEDISESRIARTMTLIYKYVPDTLGVQEATAEWMTALQDNLGDYYAIVGEGCEGEDKGEHTAILYAKAKYNLIETGTKWFSDTPDKVSRLPKANAYSIFTWALLEDKETGVRYLHVNTQLDNEFVRLEQMNCLMYFLQDYNDVAVILTGDMNATAETDAMKFIQEQGFATKQGFAALDHLPLSGRGNQIVDWILVTKNCLTLTNYITDNNYFNGGYASDHCSYYAEFTVQYPTEETLNHGWEGFELILKPEGILKETEDTEGGSFGELIRPR